MELQAWTSKWQKGEINAKETGMRMRASKSVAFSNPSVSMRAHSGPKQPNSGPASCQPTAAEPGLIWI